MHVRQRRVKYDTYKIPRGRSKIFDLGHWCVCCAHACQWRLFEGWVLGLGVILGYFYYIHMTTLVAFALKNCFVLSIVLHYIYSGAFRSLNRARLAFTDFWIQVAVLFL
jgi:hypothetical protein